MNVPAPRPSARATREAIVELRGAVIAAVVGQERFADRLLTALLADGHVLIEGPPGAGKTRAIETLSRALGLDVRGIRLTPDSSPADLTGDEVFEERSGAGSRRFQPGPIFAGVVVASDIDRAPAGLQALLLEAMDERRVTVAGAPHDLGELFTVFATCTSGDEDGVRPLPADLLDRFALHVKIDYPDSDAELEIVRHARDAECGDTRPPAAVAGSDAVLAARREIRALHVAEEIDRYVVELIAATRNPARYCERLAAWLERGASSRGAITLDRCARVHAWLAGRDHVAPDDVRALVHDVLRHRLVLGYDAIAEGITAQDVIDRVVERVAIA